MQGVRDCPILHPTEEEFADFSNYVRRVVYPAGMNYGIIKIVPPQSWKPRENLDYSQVDLQIKHPIRQHAIGKEGVYRQLLIEHRNMSLNQFRLQNQLPENTAPTPKDEDDTLERQFWRSIGGGFAPLYGADAEGSLFEECADKWHLGKLDSLLQKMKFDIPGVNTPFLYVGLWRTCFCWHTEDMDLFSISYLHFGAPKVWYGVPPDSAAAFDRIAAEMFPQEAKQCGAFLRHKQVLIHPRFLTGRGIPVYRMIHRPGEFMMTLPRAYHAGFNQGLNCAEAVNIATEEWISIGKSAKRCYCHPDAVQIDIPDMLGELSSSSPSSIPSDVERKSRDDAMMQNRRLGKCISLVSDEYAGAAAAAAENNVNVVNNNHHHVAEVNPLQNVHSSLKLAGNCTACGTPLRLTFQHPELKVLVCEACDSRIRNTTFQIAPDSTHESICRWCCLREQPAKEDEEGIELLSCTSCSKSFCTACIWRNIELPEIPKDFVSWKCFCCDPAPLAKLQKKAHDFVLIDNILCQICAKTEHDDKMLLCDVCDKGYHIFCLSPPLKRIPRRTWICPNCPKPPKPPRVRRPATPIISPPFHPGNTNGVPLCSPIFLSPQVNPTISQAVAMAAARAAAVMTPQINDINNNNGGGGGGGGAAAAAAAVPVLLPSSIEEYLNQQRALLLAQLFPGFAFPQQQQQQQQQKPRLPKGEKKSKGAAAAAAAKAARDENGNSEKKKQRRSKKKTLMDTAALQQDDGSSSNKNNGEDHDLIVISSLSDGEETYPSAFSFSYSFAVARPNVEIAPAGREEPSEECIVLSQEQQISENHCETTNSNLDLQLHLSNSSPSANGGRDVYDNNHNSNNNNNNSTLPLSLSLGDGEESDCSDCSIIEVTATSSGNHHHDEEDEGTRDSISSIASATTDYNPTPSSSATIPMNSNYKILSFHQYKKRKAALASDHDGGSATSKRAASNENTAKECSTLIVLSESEEDSRSKECVADSNNNNNDDEDDDDIIVIM